MSSPKKNIRILTTLVLIFIFTTCSDEQRITMITILTWAVSKFVLRRATLPAYLRYALNAYLFLSLVALAITNDFFYEQTFGRFWDMYFARCTCDPDVPGSGFTDWHETFRRHYKYEMALAWRFVRFATSLLLSLGILVLVAPLAFFLIRESAEVAERDRLYEHLGRTGEFPPSYLEARQSRVAGPAAAPKRDTRYMQLSDEVIFVCGQRAGFERVTAGNFEAAIARRRPLSKEFA